MKFVNVIKLYVLERRICLTFSSQEGVHSHIIFILYKLNFLLAKYSILQTVVSHGLLPQSLQNLTVVP